MVIAIVVMGIVAMLGGQILSGGIDAYQATNNALTTLGKAGYAMERMTREIREIQYGGGSYAITTMTSTRLQFTKRDGVGVDIQGALPNITLGYTSPAVTSILSDKVGALSFTYYQGDGTTVATGAANVAYVDVQLTLTDGAANYVRRTRIGLRNQP